MSKNPADAIGENGASNDAELIQGLELIRALARSASIQTGYFADEVRALLREIPNHPNADRSSEHRARLVAGHIQNAADAYHAAAVAAIRAVSSFRKHYAPELEAAYGKPARRKDPKFKFGEK